MLKSVSSAETVKHISKYDKDLDNPTIFHIGAIDARVRGYINDQSTSVDFSSKNSSDMARVNVLASKRDLLIVQFGLKGLENFMDSRNNAPVVFDTISKSVGGKNYNVATDEIMGLLPFELISELAGVIDDANKLTEPEAKN